MPDTCTNTISRALLCFLGFMLAVGCHSPRPRGPVEPTPSLDASQLAFIRDVQSGSSEPANREALLERRRWPHRGPFPTELARRAVTQTIERGQTMFMGVQVVAVEPSLVETVQQALAFAEIEAAVVTADRPGDAGTSSAVRVVIRRVDYYVKGQCAIVHAAIVRRPDWTYRQTMLYALDGREWTLIDVLSP